MGRDARLRRSLFLGAVIAFGLLADSSFAAADLFQPATASDLRSSRAKKAPSGPQVRRHRAVRLNIAELKNHVAPTDADHAANRRARSEALDGVVRIQLFPNISITARRTEVNAPDNGGFVWSGKTTPAGWTTLVVSNNQIVGQVQVGRQLFRIEPISGRVHRIIELEPKNMPRDIHLKPLNQ